MVPKSSVFDRLNLDLEFGRNPLQRLGAKDEATELKGCAFFDGLDWDKLIEKKVAAPILPCSDTSESDASNFDKQFTSLPISPGIFSGGKGDVSAQQIVGEEWQGWSFSASD